MKKILSLAIALTMLLSLATFLAIPAAAVDGEWLVVEGGSFYQPDYEDEDGLPNSICGYEYTDRGFHTIPTTAFEQGNPSVSVQSKNKFDLKEGIYMEVEIDDYTYANDKWFGFHIWDSRGVAMGSNDPKYGAGIKTLIRPSNSPDGTKPGAVSSISWYYNGFTSGGSSTMAPDQNKTTEAGQPILCLSVSWNGSSYVVDINGAAAPAAIITFMNEKWGGNDSEAYIGLNAQNANKGGKVEFTITKFGTSKDNAIVPMGDDSAEPIDSSIPPAEIADPNTVEANKPAIFMTGDKENTHVSGKPGAGNGAYSTINDEDFSIHVVGERTGFTGASYSVKKEVSYDIKDFPVAITLTRNFCTCGNEDGSCDAFESTNYYIMAGDTLGATDNFRTAVLDMSYNSYTIGEDTYLYFFCDFSEEFGEPLEGRINGIRFDVSGVDLNTEGANTFDIILTAFFRNTDEAEAFVVQYLKDNYGLVEETTEETTEQPTEETTEETTEEPETDKEEATTEKPADNKGEATTEVSNADDTKDEGGCASVIGFSAIASVVAVSAAGVVTFRKKRD